MKHVPVLFFKAHVNTYTRKDGTVVQAHEDKRQASLFDDNEPPTKPTKSESDTSHKDRSESKAGGLPTTAQYRDGIVMLHGTTVSFKKDGKTHVGQVSNKYTEDDHKRGAKIRVRVGAFKGKDGKTQNHDIDHSDIERVVKNSVWHDDYKKT